MQNFAPPSPAQPSADDALPNPYQWLPLLRESLAREGRFRWPLHGLSMTPTLPPGCTIEIVPPPDPIPLGALVVFADHAALVVHRLVHRRDLYLVTQGDNRRETDRRLLPGQVLGVVTAAYHDERRVWPGPLEPLRRAWWINRARGLWLLRRLEKRLR